MARPPVVESLRNAKYLFSPEPLTEVPECPLHFTFHEEYVYNIIVPPLVKDKIISEIDLPIIYLYCSTYRRMKDFEEILTKEPLIIDTKATRTSNPAYKEIITCVKLLTQLSNELGLTPKARGRVGLQSNKTTKKSVLDEFNDE